MGDGDSEQPVPFGEIFTGQKSSPTNDFESSLLDYSQPSYSANFRNYVDAVLQPQIQPYNSGSQLMRWDIGGPDDPLFTDLSSLKVVGRLRVQHADDTPLAPGEKVSCVNMFPESLWGQINVFCNGVPVSDHGRMVNMKSYVQKQFTTTHEVKSSSLQNEYYIGDMISLGGGWEDVTSERLETDDGLKTRAKLISESRDVNFCFKPCFDLANSERAFPAGYTLTLEFERADPKFSLLAADSSIDYKIRIYDIALEVRRFTPSGAALRALPNPRTGTFFLPFARSVRLSLLHSIS